MVTYGEFGGGYLEVQPEEQEEGETGWTKTECDC